jgi:hypothetical protein
MMLERRGTMVSMSRSSQSSHGRIWAVTAPTMRPWPFPAAAAGAGAAAAAGETGAEPASLECGDPAPSAPSAGEPRSEGGRGGRGGGTPLGDGANDGTGMCSVQWCGEQPGGGEAGQRTQRRNKTQCPLQCVAGGVVWRGTVR